MTKYISILQELVSNLEPGQTAFIPLPDDRTTVTVFLQMSRDLKTLQKRFPELSNFLISSTRTKTSTPPRFGVNIQNSPKLIDTEKITIISPDGSKSKYVPKERYNLDLSEEWRLARCMYEDGIDKSTIVDSLTSMEIPADTINSIMEKIDLLNPDTTTITSKETTDD